MDLPKELQFLEKDCLENVYCQANMNLEKSFTGQKFISHSFGLIIRSASGSLVRVILVPVDA